MFRTLVRDITVYFSNLKVMLKVELDINQEEKSAGTLLWVVDAAHEASFCAVMDLGAVYGLTKHAEIGCVYFTGLQ